MAESRTLTAAVHREEDWYVAQCLEVDVASQGQTIDAALANAEAGTSAGEEVFTAAEVEAKIEEAEAGAATPAPPWQRRSRPGTAGRRHASRRFLSCVGTIGKI